MILAFSEGFHRLEAMDFCWNVRGFRFTPPLMYYAYYWAGRGLDQAQVGERVRLGQNSTVTVDIAASQLRGTLVPIYLIRANHQDWYYFWELQWHSTWMSWRLCKGKIPGNHLPLGGETTPPTTLLTSLIKFSKKTMNLPLKEALVSQWPKFLACLILVSGDQAMDKVLSKFVVYFEGMGFVWWAWDSQSMQNLEGKKGSCN